MNSRLLHHIIPCLRKIGAALPVYSDCADLFTDQIGFSLVFHRQTCLRMWPICHVQNMTDVGRVALHITVSIVNAEVTVHEAVAFAAAQVCSGAQYTYCGGRDCNLFRLYKLPAIGTALLDVGPTSSQCSDCTTNQQCTNRDGCGPAMYAALCAERGLRPIGCRCDAANCEGDSTNIGSGNYAECNRYDCLHMPNDWSCNIDVSARTNLGAGLMFFSI